jgi:hypothetical protein
VAWEESRVRLVRIKETEPAILDARNDGRAGVEERDG